MRIEFAGKDYAVGCGIAPHHSILSICNFTTEPWEGGRLGP